MPRIGHVLAACTPPTSSPPKTWIQNILMKTKSENFTYMQNNYKDFVSHKKENEKHS